MAANNLADVLLLCNLISFSFLIEGFFCLKGFVYMSLVLGIPMILIPIVGVLIYYLIKKVFFAGKKERINIRIIKEAYLKASIVPKGITILYILTTLILLIISIVSVINCYI